MRLRFEQYVELPVSAVFAFFANPCNLSVLLDGWPGFRLLHHAGHIRPGATTWIQQTVAWCLPVVLKASAAR